MFRRTAALAACALLAPAAAWAQDDPAVPAVPTVPAHVTAGGLDVGGLTREAAARRIEHAFGRHLRRNVVVAVHGRVFHLSADAAGFVLDARRTALHASKVPPPADVPAGGTPVGRDVPLVIRHSRSAVAAFAARVARATHRSPRSARVRLGITRMRVRGARSGHAVDQGALAGRVNAALDDPHGARVLRVRLLRLRPARTMADVRRAHPTIITVDRGTFTLRLFKRLRLAKTYGVAVGMAGLSTPAGTYHIQDKQIDPAWHVPNSAWAGSLAGQTIPGGSPSNPLKARWMGLADGVGIHGTAEDWSIGSAASHGCIRMHVWDVKDLYSRVTVGTPVIIR